MPLDENLLRAIHGWSSPQLDAWFSLATTFGGVEFVLPLTVLLVVVMVGHRKFWQASLVAVGVGGAALLNQVLKHTFERSRPDLWQQIVTETSYSFPSGHAMVSLALAACVVMMAWQTRWRYVVLVAAAVYVVVIGLSRLYLGVHYPSDVVAGWLFSGLWVLVVGYITKKFIR